MGIVIVDDNATNLLIIEKILLKAGYTDLLMASSAKELYDLLDMNSPHPAEVPVDLILMDMMMPEIDGVEACRTIQADERLRDIPIIFVTAMGDSNKLAEALDAGALDYVMKPINRVELLARIRSTLRLKYEKDWHKERDKRIKYELDLAKQVQRSVLSHPIEKEDIHISAVYKPSSELAGDFYAWYPIGPNRYGIILLDMMGHGISSSLVCMYIYSALKDTITQICDPEGVIRELNGRMHQLHQSDSLINYYFTAIYMVLDTEQRTIEYVNAGHPPGLAMLDGEIKLLTEGCCAIGFFEGIDVTKGVIRYDREARIVLFTDGLSEWLDDEEQDGTAKIKQGLQSAEAHDPDDLVERIYPNDKNGSPQDDICLVMVSIP
ncbi:PP2C family protein-serine/threonine phosphatase [Paenibacillus planticolens]|uniref:SpoIIE family protein phosphatase n=1 Tax=Paenibacillus planticolens TaxID=2654976 RepID=A0ABX1ZNZ5_9BACL|nr:fused response regulator/phosphatase [Paenibacillus planticolens]NOV01797.1 SpoIIE family protein phosphatase [Paenibacillus planticolens]